jgi:hypothetical protein
MKRQSIILCLIGFSTLLLAGDKGFNPPPAEHAKTYVLTEAHDDEHAVIAIDPYDAAPKTAIFKVKYKEIGFLPVRLIISNDGPTPLMLDNLKIEYITARRDKREPASKDDIFRRISHPEKAAARSPVQLPPLPGPKIPRSAVKQDAVEEVDSAMFVTVPVMPHSTNSGFLFFDVAGIENPEAGAHIYLSGIKAGTRELFYFDIPLERAVSNQPSAVSPK